MFRALVLALSLCAASCVPAPQPVNETRQCFHDLQRRFAADLVAVGQETDSTSLPPAKQAELLAARWEKSYAEALLPIVKRLDRSIKTDPQDTQYAAGLYRKLAREIDPQGVGPRPHQNNDREAL
jgi:hypothetical protein